MGWHCTAQWNDVKEDPVPENSISEVKTESQPAKGIFNKEQYAEQNTFDSRLYP